MKNLTIAMFLTLIVLVPALMPLMSNAFGLPLQPCYSDPIVGVGSGNPIATGVLMQITSGYDGYTGIRLVTAEHVVRGLSTVPVYTSCQPYHETVLFRDQTKDFAIIGTSGILFASWYVQGSPYVGETVNINTWSLGSFSGYVKQLHWQSQYQTSVCTQTFYGSGPSGSPVQDSVNGKVVGIAKSYGVQRTDCGSGTWYNLVAYNGE